MNERERTTYGSSPCAGSEDPGEAQIRSLYAAAYPPAHPSIEPSEELERRVSEMAAQHDARATRLQHGRPLRYSWGYAAGVLVAALTVTLGLVLASAHHHHPDGDPGTTLADKSHLPRNAPGPGFVPHVPGNERAPVIANPPPVPKSPGASVLTPSIPHLTRDTRQTPGSRRRLHPQMAQPSVGPRTPSEDDLSFVNPDPGTVVRRWALAPKSEWEQIEARVRHQVPVKEDFIRIPFPQIASVSKRQIVAAVDQYKREAAIVDPRLTREVTLASKGAALSDLCDQLQAQTGIAITAGRSVADDKVTIFCEKTPLRQVMREINHLFGDTWLRSGQPGEYGYAVEQDLHSQLLEEELRNRDRDAALLALDREMQAYRPYLEMSFDELQARYVHAREPERERLRMLIEAGGWGGMQLYYRLTAAERATLLSGRPLAFSPDAANPDRRLPAEWVLPIMRSMVSEPQPPEKPTSMAETPGATLSRVSLQLDRSDLGRVVLSVTLNARGEEGTGEIWLRLADGLSPSMEKPDNARENRDLRSQATFREPISVRPKSSCPMLRRQKPDPGEKQPPHVFSGDVWEAIHRATGMSIVADYYTRPYPTATVTVERAPLFDALCRVSDAMGARWHKEGDFLLCRSASFFWDRLKEVPNRYLERWQQEKRVNGGLPLECLIEMASLSDEQLSAGALGERLGVGEAIVHCWGLDEWHLVATVPGGYYGRGGSFGTLSNPPHGEVRYYREPEHWLRREFWTPPNLRVELRFFGMLTPEQRQRALRPDGIAIAEFSPEQQRSFLQLWNHVEELRERYRGNASGPAPHELLNARLSAEYIPAGWYFWAAPGREPQPWELVRPRVAARSAAEALAAARRIDPEARPEQIHQCLDGDFTPSIWLGAAPPPVAVTRQQR